MGKKVKVTTQDKPYDNGFKRLLAISAQDFLDWLITGATFTGNYSEVFQSRKIEADVMIKALQNGEVLLAHFEAQSGPDATMALRLLEYCVLAYRRYGCTVITYVIYFKKGGERPQSPLIWRDCNGEEILRFHFQVIELADIAYEDILAKNLRGLLPLVPLAKGGTRREVIELIISRLCEERDTIAEELLSVTSLFASLALSSDEDQEWLKRRFVMLNEMLRDTPMYQHILQQGKEEGLIEGLKEGKMEGKLEGLKEGLTEGLLKGIKEERRERLSSLQRMVFSFIQLRFPPLYALAEERVAYIEQPQALEKLLMKMIFVADIEDARNILLEYNKDE